jgi:hypothetical protein
VKWFKEIKAVGLFNWLWFVVYLRRDEFSQKLGLIKYANRYGLHDGLMKMTVDRELAHQIDMKLADIKPTNSTPTS